MRITDDIWFALEPTIREKINAIRIKAKAIREAKTTEATGGSKMIMSSPAEGHKPVEAEGIPAEANNVENVTDQATDTVASLHINSSLFDANDDDETDDGTLLLRGYAVDTSSSDPEAPLTVHAHFEYATPTPWKPSTILDDEDSNAIANTATATTAINGGLPVEKDYKGAKRGVAQHHRVCLIIATDESTVPIASPCHEQL